MYLSIYKARLIQWFSPLSYLKKYISTYKDDDCGTWEYGHTPHITEVINNLGKNRSREFSNIIFTWSEFHLKELADPILFSTNKYLDYWYLYSKIFGLLSDPEELDYFAENLRIIPEQIRTWDYKMLDNVLSNLILVRSRTDEASCWLDIYNKNIKKLQSELEKRKNSG